MKVTRTSLLATVLFISATGLSLLVWMQQRELAALRASQDAWLRERAAMEKRLAEAERRAAEFASRQTRNNGERPPLDGPPGENSSAETSRRGRFRGPENFGAMLSDPKFVKAMNNREKRILDSRYSALFKSLAQKQNISPQQIDSFRDLLAEKQNTLRDVMMTAHAQNVTDRAAINQLVKSAQSEVDAQIQTTLGSEAYAQYQEYETTLPLRNLVSQLAERLSYSSAPLSDEQSQQLIEVLSASTRSTGTESASAQPPEGAPPPPPENNGGPGGPGAGFMGGGRAQISDSVLSQAQGFLSSTQLEALTQLQAQQKEQEELMQSIRASRSNANAPTSGSPGNRSSR